jgi:LysM repeat protein
MRVGTTAILAGSTLSLLFAGCQNHNMLNTRGYIPAPESEYTAPSTPPAQSPGLVVETIPVKPKPSFEQEQKPVQYQPTEIITKQPARPVISSPEKYTVKKNDSLSKIGRQYGVGAATLAAYNKIDINKPIHIGQVILIPPPGTEVDISNVKLKQITKPKVTNTTQATSSKTAELSNGYYIVKRGDSVSRIAARFKIKRADLMAANNINERSILKIGQKMVIPGKTSAIVEKSAVTKTPAATAPVSPAAESVVPAANGSVDDILSDVKDPISNIPSVPTLPSENTNTNIPSEKAPTANITAPADTSVPAVPPVDSNKRSSIEVTTDTTLAQIAAQYGVNLDALKKANPDIKDGQIIRAGRIVFLPEL